MQSVWQAWEELPEKQRMMMTPTARANNLYSFFMFYARTYFADVHGVNILHKRLFLIGVHGVLLLRFKKLKSLEDKRSRNYPTLYQVEYSKQQPLPDMPPEAVRLTIGYVLNITSTGVHGLYATYPFGSMLYWDFEFERPAEKVIQMPAKQERKRKVRAKNVVPKKRTEEK